MSHPTSKPNLNWFRFMYLTEIDITLTVTSLPLIITEVKWLSQTKTCGVGRRNFIILLSESSVKSNLPRQSKWSVNDSFAEIKPKLLHC